MELYSWADESVKVLVTKKELNRAGIDMECNFGEEEAAENFFHKLFNIVRSHFLIPADCNMDAEMEETEDGAVIFYMHFYDELGNIISLNHRAGSWNRSIIIRFVNMENIHAFAELARNEGLKGGALYEWYPCFYLSIPLPANAAKKEKVIALAEEYGERTRISVETLNKKAQRVISKSALHELQIRK
ncbi:adaptor protein MecA [Alteribacillus sp. HJP-4]|uniref:adaptor protein MecA n=1 Tax=Alteribacillus sp. HJP-4 TaxID=2775394 RepID=UPI0035CCCF0F